MLTDVDLDVGYFHSTTSGWFLEFSNMVLLPLFVRLVPSEIARYFDDFEQMFAETSGFIVDNIAQYDIIYPIIYW